MLRIRPHANESASHPFATIIDCNLFFIFCVLKRIFELRKSPFFNIISGIIVGHLSKTFIKKQILL